MSLTFASMNFPFNAVYHVATITCAWQDWYVDVNKCLDTASPGFMCVGHDKVA